jgi:carboxymethylenebutenolidase
MENGVNEEYFDIIDESCNIIGKATRKECHGDTSLAHRVVHVLVFNRNGELFLQKRSLNKDIQPGKWDTSVGGHVNLGECFDDAVYRELGEELGINANVQHLNDYWMRNSIETEYVRSYICIYDGEIKFDPIEIDDGRFWRIEEIEENLGTGIFTPNFEQEFDHYKHFAKSEARREIAMDQEVVDLYNEYSKGSMDRREFLRNLTIVAGGTVAAYSLLPELENKYAEAEVIPKDDVRLHTEYVKYPGEKGEIKAYLAKPKGDTKLPSMIVIHENRGLTPHIEDVARRVALEGFLTIAPDALSPLGGTPKDSTEVPALIQKLDKQETVKNFVAAVKYLKTNPQSTGKVGSMGFCWGGGMTNQLVVNSPDLKAAVPFYGMQPALEDVPKIKASLLIHYAGLDERINAGIMAFEEALKKASIDYKIYIYEGTQHAFFNDTSERYNKEAAQLAWKRTIAFLKEKLKT